MTDKIKAAFWRAFYRLKFKDQYNARMKYTATLCGYLSEQNEYGIGIGRNYNDRGEQIRGWHRPTPRAFRSNVHPLIAKYGQR